MTHPTLNYLVGQDLGYKDPCAAGKTMMVAKAIDLSSACSLLSEEARAVLLYTIGSQCVFVTLKHCPMRAKIEGPEESFFLPDTPNELAHVVEFADFIERYWSEDVARVAAYVLAYAPEPID